MKTDNGDKVERKKRDVNKSAQNRSKRNYIKVNRGIDKSGKMIAVEANKSPSKAKKATSKSNDYRNKIAVDPIKN